MCFHFAFASLIAIPLVIASCVVGLKMCIKIAGIKVFKSIIKLNSMEVLISKALTC